MGDLVCINKPQEKDLIKISKEDETTPRSDRESEVPYSRAVVPTVDIYAAKVLFDLMQKMVEDTVDRRISLLEKQIGERDKEIMRAIRKIQARMVMEKSKAPQTWWQRLFNRKNDKH